MGFLWVSREINSFKGKVIFSKGNGFHTRENVFFDRGMILEGELLGKCVKPRERVKMKVKCGNEVMMRKLVSM